MNDANRQIVLKALQVSVTDNNREHVCKSGPNTEHESVIRFN